MKTLIINGSPRRDGNTAFLIQELRRHLQGEVVELSAFYSNIAPCVDCRSCWKTAKCVVCDEMQVIYDDDFDNVVVASPVYYGTLPGSVLSLMSRLQPWHAAVYFLKNPLAQKAKKSAAILTAGGKGNEDRAQFHLRALFRMLNARGFEDHIACSANTDTVSAREDAEAIRQVEALAQWLNRGDAPPEFAGFQACGYRKEK